MTPEDELAGVCFRFDRLARALIDTSSIIYMQKADFYHNLAENVGLVTIPDVLREAGMPDLCIESVPVPVLARATAEAEGKNTDAKLIATARQNGLALISEDRTILRICRDEGIEHYNAYMMLALLVYKGIIGVEECGEVEKRLIDAAHYGKWVIDYARDLLWYVQKTR